MQRAVDLAWRGWGRVHPNPLVGAVVLRDGAPVGEGWHAGFGEQHAEVAALRAAGPGASGATMVVTMEPCRHHGKQPPCTEAILASGIRRSVLGPADTILSSLGTGSLSTPLIPDQYAWLLGATGMAQALAIVAGAMLTRFVLQSVPFVRWGS